MVIGQLLEEEIEEIKVAGWDKRVHSTVLDRLYKVHISEWEKWSSETYQYTKKQDSIDYGRRQEWVVCESGHVGVKKLNRAAFPHDYHAIASQTEVRAIMECERVKGQPSKKKSRRRKKFPDFIRDFWADFTSGLKIFYKCPDLTGTFHQT